MEEAERNAEVEHVFGFGVDNCGVPFSGEFEGSVIGVRADRGMSVELERLEKSE